MNVSTNSFQSDAVRNKYCVQSPFPNAGKLDRLAKAKSLGCHVIESPTLKGLLEKLGKHGVNVIQAKKTVDQYHRAVGLGDSSVTLDFTADRGGAPAPPLEEGNGPFFATEVQPS